MSTTTRYPAEAIAAVERLKAAGLPVSPHHSIDGWPDDWHILIDIPVDEPLRHDRHYVAWPTTAGGWIVTVSHWRTEEPLGVAGDAELVEFVTRGR